MSKKESNKRLKFLSDAILAVAIPFFGYFLAFNYEKAFCATFKIPQELIEIELIAVVKVTGMLIGLITTLWIVSEFLNSVKLFESPIGRLIARISAPIIITCIFIFLFDPPLYQIILISIFPAVLIFQFFIFPLLYGRGIKNYKKKVEYEIDYDLKEDTLVDKFARKIGKNAYLILFLAFMLYLSSGLIGAVQAKTWTSFTVIRSNPELIVLRKYSQNFICAPFNRERKEVRKNFIIKSVNSVAEEGSELIVENIGPLKVAEEKVISPQDLKKILNMISIALPPLGYL